MVFSSESCTSRIVLALFHPSANYRDRIDTICGKPSPSIYPLITLIGLPFVGKSAHLTKNATEHSATIYFKVNISWVH